MSVTAIDGISVGHWTDARARTGCTVVLFPEGTVASGEVRGGAPATREVALLAPERLVERVDALVLSGGSAFGLAAADGAVRWLEEAGVGFPTEAGPVPIVVGLSIFDLTVGDGRVRPGPTEGYEACRAASRDAAAHGGIGAGTGATTGKWAGREHASPGGLASAVRTRGELVVAALLVVNSVGSPGTTDPDLAGDPHPGFGATIVGLVATNARLTKLDCYRLAQGGQDGIARAVHPPHTRYDGDVVVAAATGTTEAHPEQVRALAVGTVDEALRSLGPGSAGGQSR